MGVGCSLCSRLGGANIKNYTCSCGRRLGPGALLGPTALASLPEASWTHKLPATWAFVENVRVVQLPKLLAAGPEGKVSVCLSSNYQVEANLEQAHEGLQRIPDSYWDYLTMNGLDDLSAIMVAGGILVGAPFLMHVMTERGARVAHVMMMTDWAAVCCVAS